MRLLFSGKLFARVCFAGCVLTSGLSACSSTTDPVASRIDANRVSAMVKVLASDEFEGRAPGTEGEERTVAWLIEQFEQLGLEPAGEQGSFTQAVPLIHTRLPADASVRLSHPAGGTELKQGIDIAFETSLPGTQLQIDDAEVVFVGYGVTAPERDWDDFGDIDLTGKVALFLVNDPDFAAAASEPVAGKFGNRRMTYYGRWTYKFEEAARRGAVAALVVHQTAAAGYGWNVAASSPGESYAIAAQPGEVSPVPLQGWLHEDAARALFANAGLDFAELAVQARRADFQALPLEGVALATSVAVTTEQVVSRNVLARLPGSEFPEETLMVSAHWDAYGLGDPDAEGRRVRPGANDDALGTAGVLELARVLKEQQDRGAGLQRSVVFALWTAEESGLLGSQAYGSKPLFPLATTAANLTLDILQTAGPAKDVILVGEGQSDLEDDLARAAVAQGRYVTPENLPENGLFFRADHFSLARQGVPVLLLMGIAGGADLVDGGRVAGDAWIADYIGNCYHQTCDAWSADWDLRGAVQDMELYHSILRELGNSRRWPQWREGSEFKATRDASAALRR